MGTAEEVINLLPTLPEEEQDDLLLGVARYKQHRAVLRDWRLGTSLVDENISQNSNLALGAVEKVLMATAHGRLLLTLLADQARHLDEAAKIDTALKTWLED